MKTDTTGTARRDIVGPAIRAASEIETAVIERRIIRPIGDIALPSRRPATSRGERVPSELEVEASRRARMGFSI
jgi:hypothetical protein